jgi:ubiquinone/menaquinone biosynthesis C-methylase UbiE/aminoglycoside phosphotransferase (APT) family kinase protein
LPAFACPACLTALVNGAETLFCAGCEKSYAKVDGIPVFAQNRAHYYGFIPKDVVVRVLNESAVKGWDDAVRDLLCDTPQLLPRLSRRAFDEARAVGKFLLALPPQSRILDLGCGLGALTFNLSRCCDEVVAMDLTLEHLQWVRACATANGVNNIVPVCGGDALHLPFPDGSFDVVMLNGVLEWTPVGFPGNPTDVQRAFLREVARVLNETGQVYVGIENRLSARYFWGRPEEHTKMRFAALLPRWAANALLKWRRQQEFRTYTYSMPGYRRLLQQAGFGSVQFFYPHPRYQEIRRVVALEEGSRQSPQPAATFHPRRWRDRLSGSPVLRYFLRSYAIIGRKTEAQGNLLGELIAAARAQCAESALSQGTAWNVDECKVQPRSGKLTLRLTASDGTPLLGKVTLHDAARQHARNGYETLRALHQSPAVSAETRVLLPCTFGCATVGGHDIYLEEWREGVKVPRRGQFRTQWGAHAIEFLTRLHQETQERCLVDEAIYAQQFQRGFDALRRWFAPNELPDWEQRIGALQTFCREQVMGAELPLVVQHGDFSLTNCLLEPRSGRLAAVLDWDHAERRGLPVVDAMRSLLLMDARPRSAPEALVDPGLRGFPALMFDEAHRALYRDYLRAMDVAEGLFLPLSMMYWVKYMNPKYLRYRWDIQWRRANVMAVLEEWAQRLK